jgi:hypothetical protein
MLSVNNKCEMSTPPECLGPTEKLEIRSLLMVVESILLNASHHNNEEKRQQRITLSQTMKATKEIRRTAIHQNRKTHQRNTKHYPSAPFLFKTKPPLQ